MRLGRHHVHHRVEADFAVLRDLDVDLVGESTTADDAPAVERQAVSKGGADLIAAGAAEDRSVACAIQQGLASGANEFFEFGRFEGAIRHFHRTLHAAIDGTP